MRSKDFYWLVGLLEGEGSFMKGTPSNPHTPYVSLVSTDEDVVLRASILLNTKYNKYDYKKENRKPFYRIAVGGERAVLILHQFKDYMGIRRKKQIETAISCWNGVVRNKLTMQKANNIREKYKSGEYTQESLAKLYKVSRGQIWRIINNLRWRQN